MGPNFQVIPVMTPRCFTWPPLLHGKVTAAAVAEDLGKVCLGDVGRQGVEYPARGELHRVRVAINARRQVRREEGGAVVPQLDVAHVPGQVAPLRRNAIPPLLSWLVVSSVGSTASAPAGRGSSTRT